MEDLRSAPPPASYEDDHVRGDPRGTRIIFYADFTCPRCALAHDRLTRAHAHVVFRHLALRAKHERALPLAYAAEAAAAQGAFWEFCDAVYADPGRVDDPHLWARATVLGLDVARFDADRRSDAVAERVRRDVRSALAAGATTTPTLFFGDSAHAGVPDEGLLARLGYDGAVRIPKASKDAGTPTDGRA
ncbi:MAG TPA: DsbA family protein [Solirubrobacteraceae bacterium]|nr:DsbA family protein [Solirubrobacteraceae bacterium]